MVHSIETDSYVFGGSCSSERFETISQEFLLEFIDQRGTNMTLTKDSKQKK